MFHQMMDCGEAGDQVGILLRGVKRDEIRRGMAIVAPKSASIHNYFKAQVVTHSAFALSAVFCPSRFFASFL